MVTKPPLLIRKIGWLAAMAKSKLINAFNAENARLFVHSISRSEIIWLL